MKLYATVTSERATKGQGGKYLDIIVRNENNDPCIALKAIVDVTNRVQANLYVDISKASVEQKGNFLIDADKFKTKGEKQKGDKCYTEHKNMHLIPHWKKDCKQ